MDVHALTAALAEEGSPLTRSLAEAIVDHMLSRPLAALIGPDAVIDLTLRANSEAQLSAEIARHGQPSLARLRAALRRSGETVGDSVPQATRTRLIALFHNRRGPRLQWAAGMLEPALLRELLTPVFQEFLLGFVARIPAAIGLSGAAGEGAGAGATSGLLGRLGKEVGLGTGRRLVDMGRNVMGGLGLDLEHRIQQVARDFAQNASGAFRAALQARLQSDEGQALVRRLSEHGLEHLMEVPLAELDADLERVPVSAVLDLWPELISYNLQRPLGRQLLEQEIRAFFDVEGQLPLSEWLARGQLLEPARALMVDRITAQAHAFFATDAFATWLAQLLATGA